MPGGNLLNPKTGKPAMLSITLRPKRGTSDTSGRPRAAGGVVLRELTADEKEAASGPDRRKFAEEDSRASAPNWTPHGCCRRNRFRREREAAEKRQAEEESRKAAEETAPPA